jgi:hypothetical protein
MLAGVGKQGDEAGLFDCFSYDTLVSCARAGLAAWADLAFFSDILSEQINFFVVNGQGFVSAELTEFRLGKETAISAAFSTSLIGSTIFSHLLLQFFLLET